MSVVLLSQRNKESILSEFSFISHELNISSKTLLTHYLLTCLTITFPIHLQPPQTENISNHYKNSKTIANLSKFTLLEPRLNPHLCRNSTRKVNKT